MMDVPYRWGKLFDVSYNPSNSGTWTVLSDGSRIWRLSIQSDNSFSVYAVLNNFYLPVGAKLFAYTPDKSVVLGAYTDLNNNDARAFGIAPVPGTELIIELYEPLDVKGQSALNISQLGYGYKDILGYITPDGSSLPCNVNINCPVGAPWVEQKRAVTRITFNQGSSSFLCSGAMINNTANNRTQYYLTAQHCESDNHATMTFYFNYEATGCTGNGGPLNQTVQGATVKAENFDTDFKLVQITNPIPASFNIYYAGWDRSGTGPTVETAIHHPAGDDKKISVDNNPALNSNGFGGRLPSGFWQVIWDIGMTEGGSSGSPLFDQNKRVIGQNLGGVTSQCENPQVVSKVFGKLSESWAHGGTSTNQLKDWLDPGNTGVTILEGIDGSAGLAPTPNFSASTEVFPFGGGTTDFTDLSTNFPTSWSWSFPGGTPSSSTQRNPTGISYTATGRYPVSLTATNANGSNTVTKTGYISVSGVVMSPYSQYTPTSNTVITTFKFAPPTEVFNFRWGSASTHPTVTKKFKIRRVASGSTEYSYISNSNGQDSGITIRSSFLDSLAVTMGADSVATVWRAWAYNGLDSLSSTASSILIIKRNPVGIIPISSVVPEKFFVYNNFPNPFNPTTKIKFDVASSQIVKATIYDIVGKEVARLVEERLNPGTYELTWDAKSAPSGIYFLRFETDEFAVTKRMSLLK
jgi:PKD repeat protein